MLSEESRKRVVETIARITRDGKKPTRGRVVAGLSFGFWRALFDKRYDRLWVSHLHRAFPAGSGDRAEVAALMSNLVPFRNRLAHHETIMLRPIKAHYEELTARTTSGAAPRSTRRSTSSGTRCARDCRAGSMAASSSTSSRQPAMTRASGFGGKSAAGACTCVRARPSATWHGSSIRSSAAGSTTTGASTAQCWSRFSGESTRISCVGPKASTSGCGATPPKRAGSWSTSSDTNPTCSPTGNSARAPTSTIGAR